MSVTEGDRERAAELADRIAEMGPAMTYRTLAEALAAEREKARAPFLALLDVEPDIQPLWEFERGVLRGIEMTKNAIRKAAEESA